MSLKQKLQRMKSHLTREGSGNTRETEQLMGLPRAVGSAHRSLSAASPESAALPFADQWQALGAKPYCYDGAYVLIREVRYPLSWQHGRYRFAELLDVIEMWRQTNVAHPLSTAQLPAESLLFFDTETTGLHGGVGNLIFLLGTSRIERDSVVVRQHFLPAPAAEIALYLSFLATLGDAKQLVTYNGKTFDWPQVKTRHTLNRDLLPQLPQIAHFDLLHGARRLWKDELPSCRLSLIEGQKLGVRRERDVPGQMAPLLYFDYLKTHDPRAIAGVLEHNENDLLSLITLYIHLSRLLLSHTCKQQLTPSAAEVFAIARWYERLGEWEHAAAHYRTVAESCPGTALGGRAQIALGHIWKKQKKWREALRVWEQCIQQGIHLPEEVYLEAAKICEHQLKDYEKALWYTNTAMAVRKKKSDLLRQSTQTEMTQYQKRQERLAQKLHRLV